MKNLAALFFLILCGSAFAQNMGGGIDNPGLSSSSGSFVSSFSAGTTGLTPNTATTGAVTLSGTLAVKNGGTGVSSFPTAYPELIAIGSTGNMYGTVNAAPLTFSGADPALFEMTSPSPATNGGSVLRISKYDNSQTPPAVNQFDSSYSAAFTVNAFGVATASVQTTAIFAQATGSSTVSGNDALGANLAGVMIGTNTTGFGTGLFAVGQTSSPLGGAVGAQLKTINLANTNNIYTTSAINAFSGIFLAGQSDGSHAVTLGPAMQIISSDGLALWNSGYLVSQGSIASNGFDYDDAGSGAYGFRILGSHATAAIGIGTSSGSVGIGTLTPNFELDVQSTAVSVAHFSNIGAAQSTPVLVDNSTAGKNAFIGFEDAGILKWQIGKSGGNAFQIVAGGATDFNITTSNLVQIGSSQGLQVSSVGAVLVPSLASSSSAQTGTVCWTTGTGNLTVDTTTTCLLSARRYKDDIQPLENGLKEVLALKPVSYFYKNRAFIPDRQVGLIAEDVADVDPRLVSFDKDGQLHSVRYENLTSVLTLAIQEQQKEIDGLKDDLKKRHHK